jgi:hypothetical protein
MENFEKAGDLSDAGVSLSVSKGELYNYRVSPSTRE